MKKNYSVLFVLLVVLSIITAGISVGPFFPLVGFAFLFIWLATGTIFFKKHLSRLDFILLIIVLILSGFLLYRADRLLLFLDFVGIIFFGSIASLQHKDRIGADAILIAPFRFLGESIRSKNQIRFDVSRFKSRFSGSKSIPVMQSVLSVIITIGVLAIILPLLASTNAIFSKLLTDIMQSIKVGHFFTFLLGDTIPYGVARIFLALIVYYFGQQVFSNAIAGESSTEPEKKKIEWSGMLQLPKIVVTLVIAVFFVTQYQLYFASREILQNLQISNSQQTREIFGQLMVVSFVIFGLVYLDKGKRRLNKIVTYILVAEGLFLTAIGFKSVYDYIGIGGYTTKRLYGVTGIIWLVLVYMIFLIDYLRQKVGPRFVKKVVLLTALTMVAVNIANFDRLIYYVKPSVSYMGVDYEYLARLSPDADALQDMFTKLKDTRDKHQLNAFQLVVRRIHALQKKYETVDIRTFNMSEYQQYLSVRNINIEPYKMEAGVDFPVCQTYKSIEEAQKHIESACILDLSRNELKTIPPQVFELRNLKELNLSGNSISEIPPEVAKLVYLYKLEIRDNKLTKVPAEIATLPNLRTLYLDGNAITALPEELGTMENLNELTIGNNTLTAFPKNITGLKSLRLLVLTYNSLPAQEVARIRAAFSNLSQEAIQLEPQN